MLRGNFHQILASLTATTVFISDGMQYGWSIVVIPLLQSEDKIKASKLDQTWLETTYLMAGLVGIPIIIYLTDTLGRRKVILIASVTSLTAWAMVALGTRVEYLYVGRFLMGLASNFIYVVVPMYISEIADQKIRGCLTGFVSVMMVIGLLIAFSLTPFVPFYFLSIVGGGLTVLQLGTVTFMPESPCFLIAKEKYEAAKRSLEKLETKEDSDTKFVEITKAMQQKEEQGRIKNLFLVRRNRRAFMITTLLTTFQNFGAASVVLTNLHVILTEAGAVDYLQASVGGIVFVVLMLLAVGVCSFSVDNLGRRVLLIFSSALTGLCLLSLAIYFNFKSIGVNMEPVSWIPVAIVMTYAVVYNVGLGAVPKIMCAELCSGKIKVMGLAFNDLICKIFGSLSLILYKYLADSCGIYVPFYIFAVISYLAALFTMFAVPETKEKSLMEIQAMLEQ